MHYPVRFPFIIIFSVFRGKTLVCLSDFEKKINYTIFMLFMVDKSALRVYQEKK